MGKIIAFLYGLTAYIVFLGSFLYAIGFVTGIVVPKTIDGGTVVPLAEAIIVDLVLLSIFALQHSIMARPAFKRWWTKIVPPVAERSTYVLLASLALALILWQWRPIPTVVWQINDHNIALALLGLSLFGWIIVLISTFLINHFELFGLHQVVVNLMGKTMPKMHFKTPGL